MSQTKRFNVLCCGRRWGKTSIGINRIGKPALAGYPMAWFAPNHKYLEGAFRDFVTTFKAALTSVNRSDKRIEFLGGGSIEFWSLVDLDAGRSRKYKGIAIDEAAKVRGLEIAWTEGIRATLSDMGGFADFYSTPKGRNYFWRLFARGKSTDRKDRHWMSWQMPTLSNPYIRPSEVEEAREGLPERSFSQEFLAKFLDGGGGVFRLVDEAIDRGRSNPDPPRQGVRAYGTGVDFARIEDWTVITVLDPEGRQVYFERFNEVSWERAINAVHDVTKKYPGTCLFDATGIGDPLHEAMRARRMPVTPFVFTHQSKSDLIDGLALALERRHLRLMDLPVQEDELYAYEYTMTPKSRLVTTGAPLGEHDDCVMALALAREALQIGPRLPLLIRL